MFSSSAKQSAFTNIVRTYGSMLMGQILRLTQNESVAEDLVQDTFIKLAASWKQEFTPSPAMTQWLQLTAHNLTIDFLRKNARLEQLHVRQAQERGEITPPSAGQGYDSLSDDAVLAAEALKSLSPRERELVTLKVYEERSYKEISAITGLTESNIGFILHTAMKKLAEKIRRAKIALQHKEDRR